MTTTVQLKPQHHWSRAGGLFLLLAAVLLTLYFDTASAMVDIWWRSETSPTASWCYRWCCGWCWRRRTHLSHLQPQPCAWGLVALLLVGFGWLLGELVAIQCPDTTGVCGHAGAADPALLGLAVARSLLFPLFFLFFAVPIGEFAMPQLMAWTADFTVLALRLSGRSTARGCSLSSPQAAGRWWKPAAAYVT